MKIRASQVAPVVKNLPANAGDTRDMGSVPGSGRSPGEGKGYLLQYSCLENPMDRGAWWATAHGVAKYWMQLSTAPFCWHSHENKSREDGLLPAPLAGFLVPFSHSPMQNPTWFFQQP